jgi:iron complex transport system substrate-binding protein
MEGVSLRLLSALLLPAILLAEPARIVSTAPSITETLFALGLGSRVVGVSQYCHYPPEAAKLPRVGTYLKPNAEVIARLRPDLVLVLKLPNNIDEQLQTLRLKVVEIDTGDLDRNLESMREIGQAAGVPERAEDLVARIRSDLDALKSGGRGWQRRVLFVVGRNPGRLEGIVAVGRGSYLNELIAIAGGTNVLGDRSIPYARISLETVVRLNPDVIIDMGEMADTTGVTEARKQAVVQLWRSQPSLEAVRAGRVFAVASDIYVVPGPRMVEAARQIARLIHTEAAP